MGGLASGKEATKLLRETPNMAATALWSIVLIAPQRGNARGLCGCSTQLL